ncbi:SDR family NAD(P)-dependent oxidoreductase [Microbacterium sp. NC79]|uniref:SDR family NAD(P)-dependent oxidoreductase n=1 Tax=Microbacterium sp. NC79 TaxID=2851009 RepID=UPI001C2B841A|nr:SDR family NAD(P)-dependent oxidoreductase [Microbacterium sp. NC79]MBV0896138.1 SDR family NAD(P)-dependent oxidoreductase [Microbacterium sp. NC79]
MTKSCDQRVAIVTGGGQGLGAAHVRRLAAAGASVVVNDLGVALDGGLDPERPAVQLVEEIRAAGGQAVLSGHDVSKWDEAGELVQLAVESFGRLDVLVNNAGVLRDRSLVKMSEAEFDAVIAVHLKGTAATMHHAGAYWRDRAEHEKLDARIINTTSVAGLFGNVGQMNYAAAKAGIVGATLVAALELGKYGVTANCISPGAATRMTASIPGRDANAMAEDDSFSPRWPAAVVEWLASGLSRGVTGRVFMTSGRRLGIAEGWSHGPSSQPVEAAEDLDATLRMLLAQARPNSDMRGAAW